MEIAKSEVQIVEDVALLAEEQAVHELRDIELTLVGGGSGMVVVG